MYRPFNIQQFYVLSTQCIYVFRHIAVAVLVYLYYDWESVCLLRGASWIFKYNSIWSYFLKS